MPLTRYAGNCMRIIILNFNTEANEITYKLFKTVTFVNGSFYTS